MAANGISTLPDKADRKVAKISLAAAKRSEEGTIGYRKYNVYIASVSPAIGRPWAQQISGGTAYTGGTAATTQFTDDPLDGGSSTDTFTTTIDGGAAVFA